MYVDYYYKYGFGLLSESFGISKVLRLRDVSEKKNVNLTYIFIEITCKRDSHESNRNKLQLPPEKTNQIEGKV